MSGRSDRVDGYVNRFDQRSLAWALADLVAPHLKPADLKWLWVGIGAGELENALVTLVGCCMRNDVGLPADVATTLRDWLDGYSGTEISAAFESYIKAVAAAARGREAHLGSDGSPVGADARGDRPRQVIPGVGQGRWAVPGVSHRTPPLRRSRA